MGCANAPTEISVECNQSNVCCGIALRFTGSAWQLDVGAREETPSHPERLWARLGADKKGIAVAQYLAPHWVRAVSRRLAEMTTPQTSDAPLAATIDWWRDLAVESLGPALAAALHIGAPQVREALNAIGLCSYPARTVMDVPEEFHADADTFRLPADSFGMGEIGAAEGLPFRIASHDHESGPTNGFHVDQVGVLWSHEGEVYEIVPCEIAIIHGDARLHIATLADALMERLPHLSADIDSALADIDDDAILLARVGALMEGVKHDRATSEDMIVECENLIEECAARCGYTLAVGPKGLAVALSKGFEGVEFDIAPSPEHEEQIERVEISEREAIVSVTDSDGVISTWPHPLRIRLRSSLVERFSASMPEVARPLAEAVARLACLSGAAASDAARPPIEAILLGMRERLWGDDIELPTDVIATLRDSFRTACRVWILSRCDEEISPDTESHWETAASDRFALADGPLREVVLPAIISLREGGEVHRGRIRALMPRPEWFDPLPGESEDMPWGSAPKIDALSDLRALSAPYGDILATLLDTPPTLKSQGAAVDAVLDMLDRFLNVGDGAPESVERAGRLRESLLVWANHLFADQLLPLPDWSDGTVRRGQATHVELPGGENPTVTRYLRFASPRLEVLCGGVWLANRIAARRLPESMNDDTREIVGQSMILQHVGVRLQETLSLQCQTLANFHGPDRSMMAAVFVFQELPLWQEKTDGHWAWYELAPDALNAYSAPDGDAGLAADIDGIDGKNPEFMGDFAYCSPASDDYAVAGTVERLGLPVPWLQTGSVDSLARLAALGPVAGGLCETLAEAVHAAVRSLALGKCSVSQYRSRLFDRYVELTSHASSGIDDEQIAAIRQIFADIVDARCLEMDMRGRASKEIIASHEHIATSEEAVGTLLSLAAPFGGLLLEGESDHLYSAQPTYAVGQPLLQAAATVRTDTHEFAMRLSDDIERLRNDGDIRTLTDLVFTVEEAGCREDLLVLAEEDIGFAPVLTQATAKQGVEAEADCTVTWRFSDQPIRDILQLKRGMRYGDSLIEPAHIVFSKGPAPTALAAVIANDDLAWPLDTAEPREELRIIVADAAPDDVAPEWRVRAAKVVLALMDSLWQSVLNGVDGASSLLQAVAVAAAADTLVLSAATGEISLQADGDSVSHGCVAWDAIELAEEGAPIAFPRTRFAVSSPAALARRERFAAVVGPDPFARAAVECLRGDRATRILVPMIMSNSARRLASLAHFAAQPMGELDIATIALLAAAEGATVEPSPEVGGRLPEPLTPEQYAEMEALAATKIAYLIPEDDTTLRQLVRIEGYGLRFAGRWLVEPRVVLSTTHLPSWARIALACEGLLGEGSSCDEFRKTWSALLESAPESGVQNLAQVLSALSKQYRHELLAGEPDSDKLVYDRLLSSGQYKLRYEAFSQSLEKTGAPVERQLYRSQLVRRLVHTDSAAPSNGSPVLWDIQPSGDGKGIVMRFASAVRSR
jgi:hypothetical protein